MSFVIPTELEISVGRRAFPMAQDLFAGAPVGPPASVPCGWYGSSVNSESGSFALVRVGAGLDDLIGEIVSVTYAQRQVFVYVLQGAQLPDTFDLGLARRPFAAISRLTAAAILCGVAAVQ